VRFIAIGLAIVLFWSGVAHFKNPFAFLTSILRYKLVSGDIASVVAMALPVLQSVLAGMLVVGVGMRTAFLGTAVLLSGLTAVQASTLLRGLRIGCGCFGSGNETPITWLSVTSVAAMAGVAWLCCRLTRGTTTDDETFSLEDAPPGAVESAYFSRSVESLP